MAGLRLVSQSDRERLSGAGCADRLYEDGIVDLQGEEVDGPLAGALPGGADLRSVGLIEMNAEGRPCR
ncbi:hypothetical protein [Zavarzinia compransoris]|uniref:hypothetical protein n=1 Tax=Zavarzinia compransoris TaxID=1264899 RepID=UPI003C7DFAB3